MVHCIAIIIDDTHTVDDLTRASRIISTLRSNLAVGAGKITITGIDNSDVRVYIGIGKNVPKTFHGVLNPSRKEGELLGIKTMYWGEEYTPEQMVARLRRWIAEDLGPQKILFIDKTTDLTDELTTGFTDF